MKIDHAGTTKSPQERSVNKIKTLSGKVRPISMPAYFLRHINEDICFMLCMKCCRHSSFSFHV